MDTSHIAVSKAVDDRRLAVSSGSSIPMIVPSLSDGVGLGGLGVPSVAARSSSILASVRYRGNPKRLVGQVLSLAPELLVADAGPTASERSSPERSGGAFAKSRGEGCSAVKARRGEFLVADSAQLMRVMERSTGSACLRLQSSVR